MVVYIVLKEVEYVGDGIVSVHSTEVLADKTAKELNDKTASSGVSFYVDDWQVEE